MSRKPSQWANAWQFSRCVTALMNRVKQLKPQQVLSLARDWLLGHCHVLLGVPPAVWVSVALSGLQNQEAFVRMLNEPSPPPGGSTTPTSGGGALGSGQLPFETYSQVTPQDKEAIERVSAVQTCLWLLVTWPGGYHCWRSSLEGVAYWM